MKVLIEALMKALIKAVIKALIKVFIKALFSGAPEPAPSHSGTEIAFFEYATSNISTPPYKLPKTVPK